MKKLFSVFMVLAVVLTAGVCPIQVFATDNNSPYVCEASLSDDFEEDCLLITIKDSYSQINKVWTAQQLGLTNVAEIEDLTAVSANDTNTFNTTDGFEQMLKIHLSSIGKQNVLDMMNQAIQ